MRSVRAFFVVAAVFATSCSGGGGTSPGSRALQAQSVAGKLTLGVASAKPSSVKRGRAFLSPSALSVSIAVTGIAAPVVGDISATSPACTTAGTTRTCTIDVTAPVGTDTFTATLYAGAGATGAVLGTGSAATSIAAATPFTLSIGVDGDASSIAIASSVAQFTPGTPATATLTVNALDAGGNVITGAYASPITLTNTDTTGTFTISPTTVPNSSTTVTLAFSGGTAATGTTISASASNVAPADISAQVITTSGGGLNLYVGEIGAPSFTVTPVSATGNAAPIRTVSGADTQLSEPYGIAVDPTGLTYVSNLGSSVTEYPAAANGDVAPTVTISGANTGLGAALGLGFDSSKNLYVANFSSETVTVYAPGATGNATPIRTLSGANTGISQPYGLTIDSANDLYLVNDASQFGGVDSVTVYAPGANGNATPTRTITGALTGMSLAVFDAVDSAGEIYVSNAGADTITVYAAGANGNVAPVRTISGTATGLAKPTGITLDAAGNLYVVNESDANGPASITEFGPTANGNIAPIKTITGAATGLNGGDQVTIAP